MPAPASQPVYALPCCLHSSPVQEQGTKTLLLQLDTGLEEMLQATDSLMHATEPKGHFWE